LLILESFTLLLSLPLDIPKEGKKRRTRVGGKERKRSKSGDGGGDEKRPWRRKDERCKVWDGGLWWTVVECSWMVRPGGDGYAVHSAFTTEND
jgi:hypothetical protein